MAGKNFLENISNKIKGVFIEEKNIISLYIYGSILTKYFKKEKSDIDILIISKDLKNPSAFLARIKKKGAKIKQKLDINVVFLSEFKKRWHIYRPPTYFLGIKYQHRLIFGKNLIASVKKNEITPQQIYKRVVDLAQGARGVYLNNKNPNFWLNKYNKWLRVAVLEILFLTGEFDLSFASGIAKLTKKYKKLKILKRLEKTNLDMNEISKLAENLRVFVVNNFIKLK